VLLTANPCTKQFRTKAAEEQGKEHRKSHSSVQRTVYSSAVEEKTHQELSAAMKSMLPPSIVKKPAEGTE
jgi:hypothetical protein